MRKFISECCEKYYETIKHEFYRPEGFVFRDDKGHIIDSKVIYVEKADYRKEKAKREVIDFVVKKHFKEDADRLKSLPLTLDSLDRIEIAMWAEQEYEIEIPQEEAFEWNYLSDIAMSVASKIK